MIQKLTAVVASLPNSIDTIKYSIKHLEAKVDSLQKITERAEIGKDFFSDVLGTQLALFGAIIALTALVIWGFIGKMLFNHKKSITKITVALEDKLLKDFSSVEKRLSRFRVDINRAMYAAANQHESFDRHDACFDWAMMTLESIIEDVDKRKDKGQMQAWIKICMSHLNQITEATKHLKDRNDLYDNIFDKYKNVKFEEVITGMKKVKLKYYTLAYGDNAPADLMDDTKLGSVGVKTPRKD